MLRSWRSCPLGAVLLLLLASCGPAASGTTAAPEPQPTSPVAADSGESVSAAVAAAQVAAGAWLRLVDQSGYAASWDSAGLVLQQAIGRAEWEQAVVQARGAFEPLGRRHLTRAEFTTALPHAPAGRYVVLQYATQGGAQQRVTETVVPMREVDGRWRVVGYYVRGP